MTVSSEPSYSAMTRSIRRYRRVFGRGLPFFPYGFLPLLGLALLTLIAWSSFARHSIQEVVRKTAEQTLVASNADWASVQVSGQWVTVNGVPPTPEAGERLVSSIRAARAPTWLGLARPATRVTGNFGNAVRPDAAAKTPTGAAPVLSANGTSPEYLFRLSGSVLTLDGRVPDLATRDAIVMAAFASLPPRIANIENNLETMGTASPPGFRETALRGVETLKLCQAGTSSFTAQRFNLRCELPSAEVPRVRELAGRALPYGAIGKIDILEREVLETCEEELSRLVSAARIEFEPGSDRIASSKTAPLDLAARAAIDCPGMLRIEGHTDNTGSALINQDLSLRRAERVRAALIQRGVDASRLTAAGYGPSRPIGDNATDEGRAVNRRIEISIVRTDE